MLIEFFQMHGLGNDFMVVDGVPEGVLQQRHHQEAGGSSLRYRLRPAICWVEAPMKELDFHYRFTADGSEVEQCGQRGPLFRARSCVSRGWSTGIIAVCTARGQFHPAAGRGESGHGQHGVPQFEAG